MAPLTSQELAALCRAASPGTVSGFVADLYTARGWTVTDQAESRPEFTATREGTVERVSVATADPIPEGVDAVVTAGTGLDQPVPDSVRRLDAERLHDHLLYAIDRETADRICSDWFDHPLDSSALSVPDAEAAPEPPTTAEPASRHAPDTPPRESSPASNGSDSRRRWVVGRRRTLVFLTAVVVTVGVLGAVAAGGAWLDGSVTGADSASPNASTPPGTPTPVTLETSTASATESRPSQRSAWRENTDAGGGRAMMAPLPPGIGSSGINDYGRVVETHRLALESQSYRVELVHREFRNGTLTGVSRQTVRVENATRYSATRMQSGTFVDGPSRLVGETVYANGSELFERTTTGVERQPIVDGDVYLRRHTQYLGYYLSVEDSTVVDYQMDPSGSLIRLTTDGDPWPGVQNASGNVVVTGTGVVVQVWRAYDVPDSDVRVVVTLHVSDIGETTVTAPMWVGNR